MKSIVDVVVVGGAVILAILTAAGSASAQVLPPSVGGAENVEAFDDATAVRLPRNEALPMGLSVAVRFDHYGAQLLRSDNFNTLGIEIALIVYSADTSFRTGVVLGLAMTDFGDGIFASDSSPAVQLLWDFGWQFPETTGGVLSIEINLGGHAGLALIGASSGTEFNTEFFFVLDFLVGMKLFFGDALFLQIEGNAGLAIGTSIRVRLGFNGGIGIRFCSATRYIPCAGRDTGVDASACRRLRMARRQAKLSHTPKSRWGTRSLTLSGSDFLGFPRRFRHPNAGRQPCPNGCQKIAPFRIQS